MAGRQFLAAANANGGDNKEQQGEGEGESKYFFHSFCSVFLVRCVWCVGMNSTD